MAFRVNALFSALISVFASFISTSAPDDIFSKSIVVFNVSFRSANKFQRTLLFVNPHTNLYRNASSKNFLKLQFSVNFRNTAM